MYESPFISAVSIIPPRRFLEAPVARDSQDHSKEMLIEKDWRDGNGNIIAT